MKLFNMNWKEFTENRFNYLLTILISFFVISPFFQAEGTLSFKPALPFIYVLAIIAILRTIVTNNKTFTILAVIELMSFVLDMLAHFHLVSTFEHSFHILARIIQIVIVLFVVVHLMKWLFSVEKVDADTVKGGISVYILLGLTWTALYRLVYELNPDSFSVHFGAVWEFMYFSFTTLTTVGYGNITPVSSFAMMLTNLEGMVGQLFLAIFVARLVGLHIVQSHSKGQ
jgi:hypothetical protein